MAIRSGFFNSVNGDRKYSASHFAEYFATFIGNGVFPNPSDNLQVVANNDMTVTIKAGKAWINGYILINDDDYILNIEPADGVLNRIDRIVVRYDVVDREIALQVKQGDCATEAVAPELQRDADAYELGLADILVSNGSISITQANITDLRLNSELCGVVHGTVDQVDTSSIFNQYQAWFNSITDGTEQEIADWQQQRYDDFMIWFQSIQDILEGDVAANLASRISSLENDLGTHLAESATQAHLAKNIGLEDTGGNFVATEVEGAMSELFTNVSSGKDLVGGAITDVDDSVVIPTDPTFSDLANAIGQISTGKKWASGSVISNSWTVAVSGLDFEPSLIFYYNPASPKTNSGTYYSVMSVTQYSYGSGQSLRNFDAAWNHGVNEDGFRLYTDTNGVEHIWIAIE